MARSITYNELLARYAAGYGRSQPVWGEQVAATTATALAGGPVFNWQKIGRTKSLPSLPTGVSGYIVTRGTIGTNITSATLWLVKLVNMGSLNIGTNTFTDGSAMPTVTELNTSRQLPGIILMEVTTALNATPGSLQVTYTDQSGNTAANTAQAFAASAAVGSIGIVVLNAGDTGAVDVTNAQRTGGTSPTGVIKLWGVIPICMIYGSSFSTHETFDLTTTAFSPQLLGAGDELYVLAGSNTAANTVVAGAIQIVGDST